jgi:modulator of FtsH protease HflK
MENAMAWNEPGDSKGNSPWGNKNDKGPPDLDELIKKMNDKLASLLGGKKSGSNNSGNNNVSDIGQSGNGGMNKVIMIIGLVIAFAVWMLSGIYTVDQGKQAVVLQLGAYNKTTEAGLQWHLPIIQEYYIVDVSGIQSLNLGDRESEALMLTKDENIVDVKMTVQFRIQNPENFLFNVKEPGQVLKQVTESSIREVIGLNNMDYIITGGRAEIAQRVQTLAQEILDRYKSGLIITNFVLRGAQPPEQVQHAFDDAVKAREDKQKFVNQAETYQNEILPKARGSAAQQVAEAEAYNAQVISEAEGEASRFVSILKEYESAKIVTRERLYIDAMQSVLANTSKVLVDSNGSNSNLMYLPIDKLIANQKQATGSKSTVTTMPAANTNSDNRRFDANKGASDRTRARDVSRERR